MVGRNQRGEDRRDDDERDDADAHAERHARPAPLAPHAPHCPAKAKNVIYLFMAGGPSHIDTFDYKPILRQQHGQEMPASVLGSQRVTTMTRFQGHFQTASTLYTRGLGLIRTAISK